MAFTLEQLRNQIITSIHGRRLGLDVNQFGVGVKQFRDPVTDATSDTTGTALPNYGMVLVITTKDDEWTLTDPVQGGKVTIFTGSSSTGIHKITPTAATIISSKGVAGSSISMAGAGAAIALVGLTTAVWKVVLWTRAKKMNVSLGQGEYPNDNVFTRGSPSG